MASENPAGSSASLGVSVEELVQGLSRACLDYFGMLVIEDQGLMNLLNSKENTKPENPVIIALANKISTKEKLTVMQFWARIII